ncbi:MAG: hypothetical protein LC679_10840 [Intrasporangiaceae bacterium]|nr:hypothetical protein [Intrasporangiaceae bacterium]
MTSLLRGLAAATLGLITLALLLATGTQLWQVVLYAGVFVWSVTLPGVLVHRALRAPKDRFDDLVVGSVVGLVLQLMAWALFTSLGVQSFLLGWPILVLLPFLVSARLRRHLRWRRFSSSLHPVHAWGFVVATLLPLNAIGTQLMAGSQLPDRANSWYQDDYWHLALTAQTMRSLPPDLPQVAGEPFFYHWFANAHVGVMANSTFLDLPVVFTRLWMPPVVVLGLGMLVVVGRQLSGRTWPGVLAALSAGVHAAIWPSWFSMFGTSVFNVHSPSQQFSVPITLLALLLLVRVARQGRLPRGEWALLTLALVGASGAKASVLPVLFCGLVLATVVGLLVARHLARALGWATALVGAVMTVSLPLTSGGSAGVKLQLFSSIRGTAPWSLMLGGSPPVSLEPFLPGLTRAGAGILLGLLLLSYVLAYGWMLAAVPTFSRTDMSAWLMVGVGIAGWCAMMLLNQDGFSQVYFMQSAILAWHLLAAWGVMLAWDRAEASFGRPRSGLLVVAAVTSGALVITVAQALSGPRPEPDSINSTVVIGLVAAGTPFVVVLVGWLVARRHNNAAWGGALWLLTIAGLYGAALPQATLRRIGEELPGDPRVVWWILGTAAATSLIVAVTHPLSAKVLLASTTGMLITLSWALGVLFVQDAQTAHRLEPPDEPRTVTTSETRAARWLRDNSDADDVVATNVQCLAKVTSEFCDARSFWVGAFTERRVFLEGWAYTSEAHRAHGVGGRRYANQPFHDVARFALNRAAFEDPDPERLAELRARGVAWLFADAAAGPISEELASLADEVFSEGTVRVYRVR